MTDYSDERRATALSYLRGEGVLDSDISESARVMCAVGLLICDDQGFIKKAELEAAMRDPSVVNAAENLLREARDGA